MIRTVHLPNGRQVPCLGQGTWRMGETASRRAEEIASLRTGIDHGMTLIDTAEMYGDGASERLVGEAIEAVRDQVTLVTKLLPSHAGRNEVGNACRASLKRLGVEHIDIYLLHWRGAVPLEETIAAFERLRDDGLIGCWGVSNFDVDDLEELAALQTASECATNQILYNLEYRGIEHDLLPYEADIGMPPMAYSPVGQGGDLLANPTLCSIAARLDATPARVALAWTLRQPNMIAIPKAGTVAHVHDNAAAAALCLTDEDLRALDTAFPPPSVKQPLAML